VTLIYHIQTEKSMRQRTSRNFHLFLVAFLNDTCYTDASFFDISKEPDQSLVFPKISPYGQAGRLPGGKIRIID